MSEFTFYRKNYYKTRYIFGFGRTEDVAYGVTAAITGGYLRELRLGRPYAAVKFGYGKASKTGNFYLFNFGTGAYLRESKFEDVQITTNASYYTERST